MFSNWFFCVFDICHLESVLIALLTICWTQDNCLGSVAWKNWFVSFAFWNWFGGGQKFLDLSCHYGFKKKILLFSIKMINLISCLLSCTPLFTAMVLRNSYCSFYYFVGLFLTIWCLPQFCYFWSITGCWNVLHKINMVDVRFLKSLG